METLIFKISWRIATSSLFHLKEDPNPELGGDLNIANYLIKDRVQFNFGWKESTRSIRFNFS